MQRLFEMFYSKLAGTGKVKFQWIFEDNLVSLRLEAPEKYNIRLKVPLLIAAILVIIWRYPDASISKVADVSGLAVKHVKAVVRQAISPEFPLLVVRDGKISFNPAFKTKRRKLCIGYPGFSVQKPPKTEGEAGPGRSAMRQTYQSHVMKIMKSAKSMEIDRLSRRVEREFAKHALPFRKDEYEQALLHLEGIEFIKQDPAKPRQYLYVS
jgi:hypothetical protein